MVLQATGEAKLGHEPKEQLVETTNKLQWVEKGTVAVEQQELARTAKSE
jgi:hypothetical protein